MNDFIVRFESSEDIHDIIVGSDLFERLLNLQRRYGYPLDLYNHDKELFDTLVANFKENELEYDEDREFDFHLLTY